MTRNYPTRDARLAAGFCVACGKHPHMENRKICVACSRKATVRARTRPKGKAPETLDDPHVHRGRRRNPKMMRATPPKLIPDPPKRAPFYHLGECVKAPRKPVTILDGVKGHCKMPGPPPVKASIPERGESNLVLW